MTIPTEIEKLILKGAAVYGMSTHKAGAFVLPKPKRGNYRILFGITYHSGIARPEDPDPDAVLDRAIGLQIGTRQTMYFTQFNEPGGDYSPRETYVPMYVVTQGDIAFLVNIAFRQNINPELSFQSAPDLVDSPFSYINPELYISGQNYLTTYGAVGAEGRYTPFGTFLYERVVGPTGTPFYNSWTANQSDSSFAEIYFDDFNGPFYWGRVPGFTLHYVTVNEDLKNFN